LIQKNKQEASSVRIIPLGGLGEIGMNCMALECRDEIIIIDCGVYFSELDNFGIDFIIPNFTYLIKNKDKIAGVVITHGHEDHIGAIPFLFKMGIKVPIYATTFTAMLIQSRLDEAGVIADINVFKYNDEINFKRFQVKPVAVNHSIIEASALIIKTPAGTIVHTGDFKIDPNPYYGKPLDLDVFKKIGAEGVSLLLSDSTNVEKTVENESEEKIYHIFEKLFAAAEGMVVLSTFSSSVSRMGQVFELAKKLGKKVAIAGKSMDVNTQFALQKNYLEHAKSVLIDIGEVEKHNKNKIIILATGSQGEYRSALFRISKGEHKNIHIGENDTVIMSSKFIPGNERAIGRVINNLFKQGANVLYDAIHEVHVSGHASKPELIKMLKCIKPKYFIPIHGEYRHLVHHANLAKEVCVETENARVAVNYDVIELTSNSCEIVDKLEHTPILIQGREGFEIKDNVLRERRKVANTGLVFVLLTRDMESGKLISGPEFFTKGVLGTDNEEQLLIKAKDFVKRLAKKEEIEISKNRKDLDFQENLRIALRNFFEKVNNQKPIVIPVVLEL